MVLVCPNNLSRNSITDVLHRRIGRYLVSIEIVIILTI